MKRKLFNYSSALVTTTVMLFFALSSCTKKTSEITKPALPEEYASVTAKGKPGATIEVSLSMTVNDASGNKITSDNGTPYTNGVGNVKVVFDQAGNFMFGQASSNPRVPPMTRYLKYKLDDPLPTYLVRADAQGNFISTITTATSPNTTALQNLTVGQTKCIGFSGAVPGGVINFHRNSYEDTPTSQSSYVYVTRTGLDTWVMNAVPPISGACSALSSISAFRNQETLFGYYNMPFSFTLTRIP